MCRLVSRSPSQHGCQGTLNSRFIEPLDSMTAVRHRLPRGLGHVAALVPNHMGTLASTQPRPLDSMDPSDPCVGSVMVSRRERRHDGLIPRSPASKSSTHPDSNESAVQAILLTVLY